MAAFFCYQLLVGLHIIKRKTNKKEVKNVIFF